MTVSEEVKSLLASIARDLKGTLHAIRAGDSKPQLMIHIGGIMVDVTALTAALSDQVVVPNGWRLIEIAPRDGTRILATGGGLGNEIEIVNYNERVGCWDAPNDTLDDRDDEPQGYSRPTHWQPLPAVAPASTSGEVGK